MRLALFGGTFDPIHNGHLAVAREAARQFRLAKVLVIPASHPPHKTVLTRTAYPHRYRMVELACEGDPLLEASRLEEGSEYSYSLQTIRRMRERLDPGEEMFFLIGADAFAEIDTWHRWREVIGAVDFIVVSRPGHDYATPEGARVHRLETLALTTSSSDIRARLAAGDEDVDLPAAVLEYIRQNRLYRPTQSCGLGDQVVGS